MSTQELLGRDLILSPKFSRFFIPEGLICLSEEESLFFQGQLYHPLLNYIEQEGRSPLVGGDCPFHLAQYLSAIQALDHAGCVVEATSTQNAYVKPCPPIIENKLGKVEGKSKTLCPNELSPKGTPLINLTVCWQQPSVFHDLQEMLPKGWSLIVVDDFLDPRLSAITHLLIQQGQQCALLKPRGKTFSLLPKLHCLECLQQRVLHNQPLKRWLLQNTHYDYIPVPLEAHIHDLEACLDWAKQHLKVCDEGQQGHVVCYDHPTHSTTHHRTTHHSIQCLPKCAHQGDCLSGLPVLTFNKALQEAATQIISFKADGGFRSQAPSDSIKKLMTAVSPFTGILVKLEALPGQTQTNLDANQLQCHFHKAIFNKPTFSDQSITQQEFFQVTLGKGFGHDQSQLSALGEAFERLSACYHGDEPYAYLPANAITLPTLSPQALMGFSAKQYEDFIHTAAEHLDEPGVIPYHSDQPQRWTLAFNLTKDCYYAIPFDFCYTQTPPTTLAQKYPFSRWNSNGCAAGSHLAEAVIQGIFEVIERDAVAQWWYHEKRCPEVSLSQLALTEKDLQTISNHFDEHWSYWLLDLTTDIPLPTFTAIGQHKLTGAIRMGFGCHCHATLAGKRALSELGQLIAVGDSGPKSFDFNQLTLTPFLCPDPHQKKTNSWHQYQAEWSSPRTFDTVIDFCITVCRDVGLDILVHEYHRPDHPLKSVKVIIPGCCHIWPRFNAKRLNLTESGNRSNPASSSCSDDSSNNFPPNQTPLYL